MFRRIFNRIADRITAEARADHEETQLDGWVFKSRDPMVRRMREQAKQSARAMAGPDDEGGA